MPAHPNVVVIAGPNGAGKSTTAPAILRERLGIHEFVNADTIASGLSAFAPENAAIAAGRLMLERLRELAAQRADFAFETTLSSRSFALWLQNLVQDGYEFRLFFISLASPDLCIARVASRVRLGGHDIPKETIRRRFESGHRNFFRLYRPFATSWTMYDNSAARLNLIASGAQSSTGVIGKRERWERLKKEYGS